MTITEIFITKQRIKLSIIDFRYILYSNERVN